MQEQIKQLETALREATLKATTLQKQITLLESDNSLLKKKLYKKNILVEGEGIVVFQCCVEQDMILFTEKVAKIKALPNLVGALEYGMTSILVNGPQGQGVLAVPHAMYAVRMSKEEYTSFKFQSSLKP